MKHRFHDQLNRSLVVSSGLPALDDLMGGILWGDNVVWEVASGASEEGVERTLLHEIAGTGDSPLYVVFEESPDAVRKRFGMPGLEVLDCRDAGDGEEVAARIIELGRERGPGTVMAIENLGRLVARFGEPTAEAVFVRTCPNLLRTAGVAYWTIDQGVGRRLRAQVRSITQCVISLEPDRLRIVKAEGRPRLVQGSVLRYASRGDGPPRLEPAPALRLGPALRAVREQRGLSQTDMARLAGVSPSAVSQAEQGRRGLSLETLVLLSERLGMTIDDILQGDVAPAYRLGRRSPRAGADGAFAVLLDDQAAGLRTNLVRLQPGESAVPRPQDVGTVLVAVATGLVQVLTSGGAPVLRDGEVLSARSADLIRWRNLGDDPAMLFVVVRD
jgi:transcriptional regulator with XRE-family HTH domain